jgi:RHS repeat-associated protein
MTALLAALIYVPAWAAASQESPAPPPATDRVPTTQNGSVFPRWAPISHLFVGRNDPPVFGKVRDVTLDRRGVVHVVAEGHRSDTGENVVLYSNNRWETRDLNGFAPAFVLATQPTNGFSRTHGHRIAAAPNGRIAVVWIDVRSTASGDSRADLKARVFDPATGWGPEILVAPGPPGTEYANPYLFYDLANRLHLAVGRRFFEVNPSTGKLSRDDRQVIRTIDFAPNFVVVAQGSALSPVSGNFPEVSELDMGPFVQVDSEGGIHVAWTHVSAFRRIIRYQSPAGAALDASDPLVATGWGFAAAPDGSAHFAYVNGTGLRYRTRTAAGVLLAPETIPLAADALPRDPGLDLDSRFRPLVVFSDVSTRQPGFAAKVSNPAWQAQTGSPWAVQNPISVPTTPVELHGGAEARVQKGFRLLGFGDRLYAFFPSSAAEFTYTLEYNLGSQDSFVTFPAGPNATANVATGNLSFQLPVVTTRGAGFATNLALVYNSQDETPGPLSSGWTHSYAWTLTVHMVQNGGIPVRPGDVRTTARNSAITLRMGDGRTVAFEFDISRGFHLPKDEFGFFASLQAAAGPAAEDEFLLTNKFGTQWIFRSDGKLREIRDPNGSTLTLVYGPNGTSLVSERSLGIGESVLLTIFDTMGRPTQLAYDAEERLAELEDPAGAKYRLSYDTAEGRLESIAFEGEPGIVWRFAYHSDDAAFSIDGVPDVYGRTGLLSRVFTPRGNAENYSHEFYYLRDGRLRMARQPPAEFVTEGGGTETAQAKYVFSYLDAPPSQPQEALVRNRRGHDTRVRYERRRCLATRVTDIDEFFIERTFDPDPLAPTFRFRNLHTFRDKRGVTTRYTYFAPAESVPDWVGDNLREIFRRTGETAPGAELPPITYTYTSDGLNRVASVTDARGATTDYSYDAQGNLTEILHPAAPTVTTLGPSSSTSNVRVSERFEYAAGFGRVSRAISAIGGETAFTYGDSTTGLVTEILRPAHALPERFAYDANGNLTDRTLPLGGNTHFHLDGIYRVRSQVDPSGDVPNPTTEFTYTLDSEVTAVRNPRGFSTTHAIDRLGRVSSTTNARGETTRFFYDREGNTRIVEDPAGARTVTEYDRLNRPVRVRRPGPPEMVSEMTYDPNGNVIQRNDSGRVTRHAYDVRNNLRETIHPIASLVDLFSHDANDNLLLSQRRENGAFKYGTFSTFDARNRLIRSTALTSDPGTSSDPGSTVSGLVTEFGLDGSGNRRFVRDPKGNTTLFTVDLADRQTDTVDAKGVLVMRVLYNDNDLRSEVRIAAPDGVPADPEGLIRSQSFEYNLRNELKTVTDFFGARVTHFYDANSNLVRTEDELGIPREFVMDELDRVREERVQIKPGAVAVTAYTYDSRGNRDTIRDPRGNVYDFDYDDANRLIRLTYPPIATGPQPGPSHVESWTYTEHGEVHTHTDPRGVTATHGYDPMGRLRTETYTQGTLLLADITREYDGASNLLSVSDAVSGLAVEYVTPAGAPGYDALNRPTDVRWRIAGTIFKKLHMGYDAASNREFLIGPEGEGLVYVHDPNNRLAEIHREGVLFAAFSYDRGGRLRETRFANGMATSRSYDGKGQLRTIRTRRSDGTLLAGYAYEYTPRGERRTMEAEHLGVTVAYGYTDNSWLESEVYSGAVVSTRTYEYDAGGNRIRAVRDGVVCDYFYDEENRLFLERCASGAGGPILGVPVVSSTKPGHDPAVLVDGDTTDRPDARHSWRNSERTPGEIFAGLDFGTPRAASEVRFFIPTMGDSEGAAGMRRFKIQVGDGGTFNDVVVTGLQGAEPSPTPGWLQTVRPTEHEVRVGFSPVTGRIVRVLMDLGPPAQPRTMRLNELQAFGPAGEETEYFYDAAGNQTRRVKGDVEEVFGYDYRNLLVSYVRRRISSGGIERAFSYSFMPTGERLNKMNVVTGETRWSMYDGADVMADYGTSPASASFTLSLSYVNALAIDSKIARIDPSGARHFYVTDALGSATALVDNAQQIVNSYFTTAWGEDLVDRRAVADRYGFAQRERDDESALMDYRARSYDPRLGRFVQTEPASRDRPQEHYVYARNAPTGFTDPMGTEVRLVGEPGRAVDKFITFVEEETGAKIERTVGLQKVGLRIVFVRGEVPKTATQKFLFDKLDEFFRSPDSMVLTVVEDSSAILIDLFQARKIDVSDLIAIRELDKKSALAPSLPTTPAAQHLLHAVAEHFRGWTSLKNIDPKTGLNRAFFLAHARAIADENEYRKVTRLPAELLDLADEVGGNPDAEGGPYQIGLPYRRTVGTARAAEEQIVWEAYKFPGGTPTERVVLSEDKDASGKTVYRKIQK